MDTFIIDEETCTKCGACAEVCYAGIIDYKKKSYPKPFSVTDKICSRCGACVIACPSDSLILRDVPLEEYPPINESLKINYDQCAQLLKTRRSIRTFKDKPVPREDIEKIIDAAKYSPTGGNVQNVQWLVFDDKDEMKHLREIGNEWLLDFLKTSPAYAHRVDDEYMEIIKKRREAGVDGFLRGAPVLVCAISDKDLTATNCNIALAYLDIAAISLGLGCCWIGFFTLAATTYPPIKEAIALPEGKQIYGSMVLGYPKYKYHRIPTRKPASITWHSGE